MPGINTHIGIGSLGIGRTGGGWNPSNIVVENAEPTKVVMTGSVVNANAVASDFTIAGFTVSSLARDVTNKILTLTLSTIVEEDNILTVVYKGKSYLVTNNISLVQQMIVPVANPNRVQLTLNQSLQELGAELIDQSNWYKSTYWDTFNNVTQDGTILRVTSGNLLLFKNGFLGDKSYQISCTITRSAGTFYWPYAQGGNSAGTTIISETKTYNYYAGAFTQLAVYGSGFVGTITALSIKEITSALPNKSYFAIAGKTISSYSKDDATNITFYLTSNFNQGDKAILVYDKPTTNPLKYTSGQTISSFYKEGVNNSTNTDLPAPTFYSAFIQSDFSASALTALRNTIISRIWPSGMPVNGKNSISVGVADILTESASNLASIDLLTFQITGINDREVYVWHPITSNGKFVIYHIGHFGGYTVSQALNTLYGDKATINALIDAGYTVAGVLMPPGNTGGVQVDGNAHSDPVVLEPYNSVDDLHYFFDTNVRVLNEYAGSFSAYYMGGHSGGGWTTGLFAAIDVRITKSMSSAGLLSKDAYDEAGKAGDWEQFFPGLTDIINVGDIFALSCTEGRKQMQQLICNEASFNFSTYRYAPYVDEMKAINTNWSLNWETVATAHEMSTNMITKLLAFFAG